MVNRARRDLKMFIFSNIFHFCIKDTIIEIIENEFIPQIYENKECINSNIHSYCIRKLKEIKKEFKKFNVYNYDWMMIMEFIKVISDIMKYKVEYKYWGDLYLHMSGYKYFTNNVIKECVKNDIMVYVDDNVEELGNDRFMSLFNIVMSICGLYNSYDIPNYENVKYTNIIEKFISEFLDKEYANKLYYIIKDHYKYWDENMNKDEFNYYIKNQPYMEFIMKMYSNEFLYYIYSINDDIENAYDTIYGQFAGIMVNNYNNISYKKIKKLFKF